ncbi:hypothetical protein D3C76_1623330 [compost metagenome]
MQAPKVLARGSCDRSRPSRVVMKDMQEVGCITYGAERDWVGQADWHLLQFLGQGGRVSCCRSSMSLSVSQASRWTHEPFLV